MTFHEKQRIEIENEFKAGGTDNVPPACCIPPACTSACVPAHVECTGRPLGPSSDELRSVCRQSENLPILKQEAHDESG